jgi:hypothetical protein
MLPTNLLYRTFFIRAQQYGTAFALEFDGKQYLVTAKHLIDRSASSFDLKILHNGQWLTGRAEVVGRAPGEIDIALLRVAQQLTPPIYEVAIGFGEIELGQDIYFLAKARPQEVRIAGVVSKYKTEQEAVLDSQGEATDMVVPYNTGFMVAYDIKYAVALAKAHAGV